MTLFPGQVYLERIRETLWGSSTGSSGAAALIGAGFSRNADRLSRSALPFPVWKDVARAFCTQLGRPETDADATSSILLGSEYQAVFGRQQLDDFIATIIPQKGYAPGQAHHLLLSLPWQDLFTTNYDTLLEDARSGVLDRAYSMVSRIEDLPGQPQPRIVKLHGSFPSVRPFIFTEEDFRTYPRRFAPLVNLVQQSLMEHTLVALGFSGDDPNFAAWSGWVRDELGAYAPNIYLCGWYDFPAARQKYFLDRGVIPVDLAPLFPASHYPDPGARHALSTLWLLESLHSAEPHYPLDWPHRRAKKPTLRSRTNLHLPIPPLTAPPSPVHDTPCPEVEPRICMYRRWRLERESYPGWVVCPPSQRKQLWSLLEVELRGMGGSEHFSTFADLPAPLDLLACAELAWQIDRVQMPLIGASAPLEALLERYAPFPELEGKPKTSESEVLTPASHPTLKLQDEAVPAGHRPTVSWSEVGRAWIELGFFVLQHGRDTLTPEAFERWHARLEPGCRLDPEWRARWHYERALFHLSALELESLQTALARWPEDLSVPYFEILRATLLAELGQDAEASRSVRAALGAIRGRLTPGQTDYALLSQEGWALTLLDRLEREENASGVWTAMQHSARLDQLRLHLCDPHAYLEASSSALELFSETVSSWLEVQRPAFDPERIIRGTRMHSSSTPLFWAFGWLRLLERGGVPTRVGSVSYDMQTLVKVAKIVGEAMPLVGARLYFRAHTPELLEQFYAREVLAALEPEVVSDLFNFIFAAYKTARTALIRQTQGAWGGLYRAVAEQAPEVISRLVHFLPLEQVKEALDFLVGGYQREQDRLNSDRVAGWDLILARLVARLSPAEAVELLPRLLEIPLTGERKLPLNQGDGGDFFSSLAFKPSAWQGQHSAAWTSAIDRLLIHMESEQLQTRSQALRRLHFLYKAGVFSEARKLHFSSALWNYTDEVGLPLQNSLYPVALLALPEPSSGYAESILRSYLLGPVPNIVDAQGSRQYFLNGPHPAVMWFKTLRGSSQRVPADERSGLEAKLEWTEAQAGDLLERLVTWWSAQREHQDVSFSVFSGMDDLTSVTQNWLPAVLTEVILPRLTLTDPAFHKAQSLIDDLRLKGCWSPRYELLSQLFVASGFETLEHEIGQGLLSGIPAQRNQSIWGAFQWLGLARLRDITPLPEFVRGLLFAQVSSHDPEGIRQFVEALADLVRYIPESLEPDEMESLFEVARQLEGVTRLAQTSGDRPDPGRPAQRLTASRLAWALNCWHSYHAEEPNLLLESLQQIYTQDVLYEVRKVWWE